MSDLLKDSSGHNSSKRWFGALCFLVAVGLAIWGQTREVGVDTELVKAFLWPDTVVLVGGEALKR